MSPEKIIEVAMCKETDGMWSAHSTLVNGMCRYSNETKESYVSEGFTVMALDEAIDLLALQDRSKYMDDDYVELTEDQYMDGIEQLPPHRWYTCTGVNFYECLEAMSGDIRGVWIRYQGKYYHNYVSDMDSPEQTATHFLNWIACKGC